MISSNVYVNNVITEDISNCRCQYCIGDMDKNIFTRKLKNLLAENDMARGRKEKSIVVLKIIDVLNDYSFVWNNSNDNSMRRFSNTVKYKFTSFLKEEEVKKECSSFLARYFDEKCRAYTKWGVRCRNHVNSEVKGNFCKVHVRFHPKIISILETVIPTVIAYKCAKLVYTDG